LCGGQSIPGLQIGQNKQNLQLLWFFNAVLYLAMIECINKKLSPE
jgi:hypothetical protein